ncbi:MAG: hypothetical protein QXV73_04620 [Candidatus Micrarchaeia archaeon]
MENTFTVTSEELSVLQEKMTQIRQILQPYMEQRDFRMSNPQLFVFLMYAPLALAISSDGVVDQNELAILEKVCKYIDVKQIISIDLFDLLTKIGEPQEVMTNEEFNMRIDSELLYLARNFSKYEKIIIDAAKKFLSISKDPTSGTSLHSYYNKWFDFITSQSVSKTKAKERQKIEQYKKKLFN